jgi:hypothetical protein
MLLKGMRREEVGAVPFVISAGVASKAAVAFCEMGDFHNLLAGQGDTSFLTVVTILYDRRSDLSGSCDLTSTCRWRDFCAVRMLTLVLDPCDSTDTPRD